MSRDRTQLHPKLQTIAAELERRCKEAGLPLLITDCRRTQAEQAALYAKGRTAPGGVVTNVQYPNSAHNWGVAIDFCRNVRGREYDDSDGFFRKVGEIGESLGLTWGGRWKNFVDKPHLELAEFMPNSSTSWLRKTYGTPEAFIQTWGTTREEELEMTEKELLAVAGTGDNPAEWARESTEWAKANGIFNGDGVGNYGWQKPITREAVAVILHNFAQTIGRG